MPSSTRSSPTCWTGPALVLALGGGAAEHPGTRERLAAAEVVYLQVGYEQALHRVGGDPGRPLLARPDLAATYQRRLPVYAGIATLTVPTDGRAARGRRRRTSWPACPANPPRKDPRAAAPP